QQERHPAAHWHDNIETLPKTNCIVIANEFFDALPVHQYIKTEEGWQERCVDLQGDDLCFITRSCDKDFGEAPLATIKEDNPLARHIVSQLYPHPMLILDYGYITQQFGNSLQAVLRHQYVSPLSSPGEADLTTHVNFTDLAQCWPGDVYGPVTQQDFLV